MKRDNSNIVNLTTEGTLKERSRTRIRRSLFSLTMFSIVLIAFYFASPLSKLGVVNFDGLVTISRSELISLADIDGDEFFIRINLTDIQNNIENHPMVSEVHITRSWINRLHIEIVEHTVVVCALIEEDMFHILSDGVMITEDAGILANCDDLVVQGLTHEDVEADVLGVFARQLMNVESEIKGLIRLIEYAPAYGDFHRFSLFMIDGNTVNVNSYTMPEQLNVYPRLLPHIEAGQTGTFHLDVGGDRHLFFEPFN